MKRVTNLWSLIFAFAMALSLPPTGWADDGRHSGWEYGDNHGCSGDKHQQIVVHLKRHINDLQGAVTAVRLAFLMQSQECADVTLFLTLQGPRLADSRMPQDLLFGTAPEEGTLADFVDAFLGVGGHIAVCPACGREIGLTEDDLIAQYEYPGQVTIPGPPEIAALFLAADKVLDF